MKFKQFIKIAQRLTISECKQKMAQLMTERRGKRRRQRGRSKRPPKLRSLTNHLTQFPRHFREYYKSQTGEGGEPVKQTRVLAWRQKAIPRFCGISQPRYVSLFSKQIYISIDWTKLFIASSVGCSTYLKNVGGTDARACVCNLIINVCRKIERNCMHRAVYMACLYIKVFRFNLITIYCYV